MRFLQDRITELLLLSVPMSQLPSDTQALTARCTERDIVPKYGCQLFQGYISRQKVSASPFSGRSCGQWVWCACSISDHTLPLWLLKGFSVIGCSC